MREEDMDDPDPNSSDIESKTFWNKIAESLALAMELLQEMVEEQGIELNDMEDRILSSKPH
jgi:hypothetical protein